MSRAARHRTFAGMGHPPSRHRPLRFVAGYDGSLGARNATYAVHGAAAEALIAAAERDRADEIVIGTRPRRG
jgi:nucleotide-binding universal stress UspA family protein